MDLLDHAFLTLQSDCNLLEPEVYVRIEYLYDREQIVRTWNLLITAGIVVKRLAIGPHGRIGYIR